MREEFKTHWIACNSLMTSVKETEELMKEYWCALVVWCLASGTTIFYVTAEFFWYKNPKSVTSFYYLYDADIFYPFVMSVVRRANENKVLFAKAVAALCVVYVVWSRLCWYVFVGFAANGWKLEFLYDYTCKVFQP